MSKKINNKLSSGEFFEGVKNIEEEIFRNEYNKIIKKRNAAKSNLVMVICIFCKRPAVETEGGCVCPKCGHKPFKGVNLNRGYFTCQCGLLVDHKSKICQGCNSYNNPLRKNNGYT